MSEKTPEEILFPDVEVDGIIVKPWSFGMLFEISDSLEKVLDKMEEKGLTKLINSVMDTEFISYIDIVKIFTIAGPQLRKIIALTLNKSEEEVAALDMKTGIQIVSVMFSLNSSTLKNALAPLFQNQNPTEAVEEDEDDVDQ